MVDIQKFKQAFDEVGTGNYCRLHTLKERLGVSDKQMDSILSTMAERQLVQIEGGSPSGNPNDYFYRHDAFPKHCCRWVVEDVEVIDETDKTSKDAQAQDANKATDKPNIRKQVLPIETAKPVEAANDECLKTVESVIEFRRRAENYQNGRAVGFQVNNAIQAYLTDKVKNEHSARAKKNDLTLFREHLRINHITTVGDLGRLTSGQLSAVCSGFLNALLDGDPSLCPKGPNSMITVMRKKTSLVGFLGYLNELFPSLIPFIPRLDEFKQSRSRGVTEGLDFEEWFQLKPYLQRSRNKELYPLVMFALATGGRRISECLSLKWSDIDFDGNSVKIRPLKKNSRDMHALPLHPDIRDLLLELRKVSTNDHVFRTSQQSVDKSLKLYARKAGLKKKISFHSLRASFITWSLERGDTLSEVLNASLHASAAMVRYYDRTNTKKINSIHKTKI